MLEVHMPIRTVSEANRPEHWAARHGRAKKQRTDAWLLMRAAMHGPVSLPLVVTLVRVAPRALDSDNLARSLKAVRDGVADALGLADDRDSEMLAWKYAQRRGRPRERGVIVRVAAPAVDDPDQEFMPWKEE